MSNRARRALAASVVSILLVALTATSMVDAAVTTAQWNAKVGSGGANGTATIKVFATGTGSLAVALKGLAHSAIYTETVQRGTCAKPSTKLLTLPTIKSTSTGTAARTNNLTAAQATAVNKTGEIIRLVAGTHVFCGPFTAVKLPPPPPPPPAIAATIKVGSYPTGVALTPTGVLVANYYDGTLSRVDPTTNTVLSSLPLTITGIEGPQAVAFGEGAIWVAMLAYDDAGMNVIAGSVERLDPVSGQVIANIPIGKGALDITTSPGAVWVADYDDNMVVRIDPATNQVVTSIKVGEGPASVAFGFDSIWVASETAGNVSRIDPATNQVLAPIPTVSAAESVAVGAGSVWVANWGHTGQPDGVLSRIDPATNQVVRAISVGTNPVDVAFGGGFAWVALHGEGSVVQVNPATNAIQTRVSQATPVMGTDGKVIGFWSIAATDHAVWVVQVLPGDANTAPPPGSLVRINY